MNWRTSFLSVLLLVLVALPGRAQTWETPTFFAPRPHDDIGVHLIKPDGGDLGVLGIWRQSGGINLGVRGGVGGRSNARTALVGAELFGPVNLAGADPLAFYWVTGIGAAFRSEYAALRIPLGVSAGVRLGTGGTVMVTPYVHPRLALDIVSFESGDRDRTNTDLNVDVDLGADLELSRSLVLRFGATLGHQDVIGLGLGFRTGRGAAVASR